MVIKLDMKKMHIFLVICTLIIVTIFIFAFSENIVAGGVVHKLNIKVEETTMVYNQNTNYKIDDRFHRPSNQKAINNKYLYSDYQKKENYKKPEDIIYAYYGILKEASNMLYYSGGCGSIGDGSLPYSYAYDLFTKEAKQKISLREFEHSFNGIGHISLLKVYPAYIPEGTPHNIRYYFIETEFITGYKTNENISLFKYYYGLVTIEDTETEGWKIKKIDYIPEAFLCAPYHSWFYLGDAVVEIVYGEWYKLIDKIDEMSIEGDFVYIYASGNNQKYRFDFVRITNGYDILLHENILEGNNYREINLLKSEDQTFKLSILNPQI